jgi:hypothetical protein
LKGDPAAPLFQQLVDTRPPIESLLEEWSSKTLNVPASNPVAESLIGVGVTSKGEN